MLAQLALMYWRPDFSPAQVKQFMAMYLEDLRPFPMEEISDAIKSYRREPDTKFFPTVGQLLAYITKVPAWDVISQGKHVGNLKRAAEAELEAMEGSQVQNVISLSKPDMPAG